MTDKPKPSVTKRISDVSHPNSVKATATSKPDIVSNREVMNDPMMTDAPVSESADKPSTSPSATRLVLQPLSAPELPIEADQSQTLEPEEEIVEDSDKDAEPLQDTETADKVEEESITQKDDDHEEDVVAEVTEDKKDIKSDEDPKSDTPGTKDELNLEAAAEKEAAREAELQKLIDSKKYFVPINTVEDRRAKRFIVMGVLFSIILAAVWFDIALDAQLIHVNNLKPLTHFFSS